MKGSTCLKYTVQKWHYSTVVASCTTHNAQMSHSTIFIIWPTQFIRAGPAIYKFRHLRVSTSWSFTQRVNVVFFYLFIVPSVFRFQRPHVRTHTQPPTSTGRPPSNPSFWRTTFTLLGGQLPPPPPPSSQPRTQLQGERNRGEMGDKRLYCRCVGAPCKC